LVSNAELGGQPTVGDDKEAKQGIKRKLTADKHQKKIGNK